MTARMPMPLQYSGYASLPVAAFLCSATVLFGSAYVLLEWFRIGAIKDALFVSLLIAASLILILGIRRFHAYLGRAGLQFFMHILSGAEADAVLDRFKELHTSVMHGRNMTISGVLYGFAVGGAPLILNAWPEDRVLCLGLGAFLFVVNFVTGVAFYGLLRFFFHSLELGRSLKVDLWHVNNPSTEFVLGATRRIAVLSSIYVSICLSSVVFSVLPVTKLVVGYSCFAAIVMIASIIVPVFPIQSQLRLAKLSALMEVETQLQDSFQRILGKMKDGVPPEELAKFDSLVQLKEKIEGASTWPFRVKSLMTSVSVIFFSAIPVLLQVALEHLNK